MRMRSTNERPDLYVKNRTLLLLPALAASALVTTAVLGAGPASAGTGLPSDCTRPGLLVSPSHSVSAGSTVTVTGTNFTCHVAAGKTVPVTITFYTGPLASRHTLSSATATAKNGSFTASVRMPASGLPAGSEVDVLAQQTNVDAEATISVTVAGSSGSGGSISVPAGHVDVSAGPSGLDVALLSVVGIGLVAGGVTVATRRRAGQSSESDSRQSRLEHGNRARGGAAPVVRLGIYGYRVARAEPRTHSPARWRGSISPAPTR
jgi:hypothetical protein